VAIMMTEKQNNKQVLCSIFQDNLDEPVSDSCIKLLNDCTIYPEKKTIKATHAVNKK